MAEPSYLQSVTLSQESQLKEVVLHLYLYQNSQAQPKGNQCQIVGSTRPHAFGATVVNDWTIHDGPSPTANIVARAQGLHLQAGMTAGNWFVCHNIVFTDDRFKGSTLNVLGNIEGQEGQWAIVGGTGEFAYAQGVVSYKPITSTTQGKVTRELHIRALCITLLKPPAPVVPTASTVAASSEMVAQAVVPPPAVPATPVLPTRSEVVPTPAVPALPVLPTRSEVVPTPVDFPMVLTKYGPWGPENGEYTDMQNELPQRLVDVTFFHGLYIYIMTFSYIDHSGVTKYCQLGGRPVSGSMPKQMNLEDGEFVKSVSGTTGLFDGDARLTSVSFVTNLRSYGPFGREGKHASFSTPELNNDSSIVGFFAWHLSNFALDSTNYLSSLGVYVASPRAT
ncbi:hypothetical protein ZWY2020_051361 [Hordeum vulgare]|nr:hypothetical protein ZWY2020_051361 [Hordeum vulgare]